MTDHEIAFHNATIFEEIKIIKKNFSQPLDEVNKILEVHCDIGIRERVTPIPNGKNSFYISKDVEVFVLGSLDNVETTIAEIRVVFTFRFNNTEHFIRVLSPESVKLDTYLSEWLDNVALATTRGIMFSEFRGTYVGEIILPIIRPSEISTES